MSSSDRARAYAVALAAVLGVACGSHGGPTRPEDAGATDAGTRFGCPILRDPVAQPGDDIGGDDWESFARGFFATYCTRCHSSTLTTPAERGGAPEGLNWDDEAAVRANLQRIRNAVGVQNFMPPSDPLPSCEERRRLVRWIDADAP
ncbi:MAG TPA: hypothetical protein VIL20_31320 [Sandaracinaceae bacterium]